VFRFVFEVCDKQGRVEKFEHLKDGAVLSYTLAW
jgi:hypothetical protein